MNYFVSTRDAERLVIGTVHGVLELGGAVDFSTAVRQVAVPLRYDVLVDFRNCQVAISLHGLFQLPDLLQGQALQWQHDVLVPHLVKATDLDMFLNFEAVVNRAGARYKFFTEEADAMHWLAEQRSVRY